MDLHFVCHVQAPLPAVFAFHENPEHLNVMLRGRRDFRLLHHDGSIRPGCETWVEQRVGILPVVLGFRHVLYEPPHRFGEELIHGPFKTFRHIHEFVDRPGGTAVEDRLCVDLPIQYGGHLAMRFLAAPRLCAFFAHRHGVYAALTREGAFHRAMQVT
jgi:ligand-binding SRPBCC domain-containing protein